MNTEPRELVDPRAPAAARCPACGGPMYGWVSVPATSVVYDSCDRCGHTARHLPANDPGPPRTPLPAVRATVGRAWRRRARRVARALGGAARAVVIDPTGRLAGPLAERGIAVDSHLTVGDAAATGGRYPAVVVWGALEAMTDPAEAMAMIAGLLEPGGTLVCGFRNRASLQAEVGGGHWLGLTSPRPSTLLTPDSLRRLAAAHGLRVRRIAAQRDLSSQFAMWQTLLNGLTFTDNAAHRLATRESGSARGDGTGKGLTGVVDIAVSVFAGLPGLVVSVPLELVASLVGRSGAAMAVAETDAR